MAACVAGTARVKVQRGEDDLEESACGLGGVLAPSIPVLKALSQDTPQPPPREGRGTAWTCLSEGQARPAGGAGGWLASWLTCSVMPMRGCRGCGS